MKQKLISVASTLFQARHTGCIDHSVTTTANHTRSTVHALLDPTPEAFLINFNYPVTCANSADILAIMLSIPEGFSPKKELYKCEGDDCENMLRGVVLYTGAHYMTYVRKIKSKIAYVIDE